MAYSLTHLRKNIFQLVDQVIETGEALDVMRHGKHLKLVVLEKPSRLSNLKPHPQVIKGSPESVVHIDWGHEWKGKKLL